MKWTFVFGHGIISLFDCMKFYFWWCRMFFGGNYEYLFLKDLIDTNDNELTVDIVCSKPSPELLDAVDDDKVSAILSTAVQLVPDDTRIYRIRFEHYIIYQGRNESYAYNDDRCHTTKGKGLILFERSKLLEYVSDAIDVYTAMHMEGENKLRHYGIYTLNNIIDVVTFFEPIVEKVKQQ